MRTARFCFIATAFAAILSSCSDSAATGASAKTVRQQFADGSWTLTVDRVFQVGSVPVPFPSTPLPESGYAPASAPVGYLLTVWDGAATIKVTTPKMDARLESATDDQLIYNVESGAFADGRIVVSKGSGGVLQGELTIFGSGLPVTKSERGAVRQIVALAN